MLLMTKEFSSPIGHIVEDFTVLGDEFDGDRKRVGVDMELRIRGAGSFFINVVTKDHFADEKLADAFRTVDQPNLLMSDGDSSETKPPYVLNDHEITEEVLERKFQGRVVEADLASSLWHQTTEH